VESAITIFQMSGVGIAYSFRNAVEDLTLDLQKGGSLGLLGLNGAGKTSTIRSLLGMIKPKRGTISILGDKPGRVRNYYRIGFAPEDGLPPEYLTGEEYLNFVGALKIRSRVDRKRDVKALLDWFELSPKKRIGDYSKGMQRKLILAQSLLGNPEFLILDEPLNGLDPLFILRLRQKLEDYLKAGGTYLLSSHILAEVEKTCHEVAILHEGKLVSRDTVENLAKEFGSVENAFAKKIGKS